jgi:hypothetical protein
MSDHVGNRSSSSVHNSGKVINMSRIDSKEANNTVSHLVGASNRASLINAQFNVAMDREIASTIASAMATIEKLPAKNRVGIMASADVYIDRINTYLRESNTSRDRAQKAHMAYQDARMRLILSSKNLTVPKKGRIGDTDGFKQILDNAKAMSDALDERAIAGEAGDRMAMEIRSALNELASLAFSAPRARHSSLNPIVAN